MTSNGFLILKIKSSSMLTFSIIGKKSSFISALMHLDNSCVERTIIKVVADAILSY